MSFQWWYVLDEHGDPVPEPDAVKWGEWFHESGKAMARGETGGRLVDRTELGSEYDDVAVSTVFLGMDHGWGGGRILLYETMIFGGEHEGQCWRWSNKYAAQAGHDQVVMALLSHCRPDYVPVDAS